MPTLPVAWKAAVVMNAGGFDEARTTRVLQDYVKGRLLPYKYPREITFVAELPKTGTGKFDKKVVRDQYADLLMDASG